MIAGAGRTPFLVAEGVRRAGRRLIVVGLRDFASQRLADLADEFVWSGLTRLGQWLSVFRSRAVREVVMIGGVKKREMYSPLSVLRHLPDLAAIRLWFFKVREDRRDNAVLAAVVEEFGKKGIQMVSCVKFCEEHLAADGLMTRTPVPRGAEGDVEFGWRIARASAELDIGQAIAVKGRDIVAVEAIEGTDSMIRRAGRLCRVGAWTLVKVARPKQDMRFDVPTVGPGTLRNLKNAKCACLVLEAGKTLIVDKPITLALADKLGIAVVGKRA
jgi:DUF1009 family protein